MDTSVRNLSISDPLFDKTSSGEYHGDDHRTPIVEKNKFFEANYLLLWSIGLPVHLVGSTSFLDGGMPYVFRFAGTEVHLSVRTGRLPPLLQARAVLI